VNDTFTIRSVSVRIRPMGEPETATFRHVHAGDAVRIPTSGDAGAEDIIVCGERRRLGPDRYEVIGADQAFVGVKLLRPPASGIVTLHWTSRHRWQAVGSCETFKMKTENVHG
jgi:hypothetical protein